MLSYGRQSISNADIQAVVATLKSDWLTQGPKVKAFEKALASYCGAQFAVAVSNGTAALHLAALAAEWGEGDQVITSPLSFAASANCVLYVGASARFADIDEATGLISPTEIEKHITPNTKGLIPVHYAGQACDMAAIARLAKKHRLTVIEDAAHAIGSQYHHKRIGACQYSDMTTFSFHPVKTMTTGEGGAILTNRADLYEKLIMLRTHGITKEEDKLNGTSQPWYYEMQMLGFNYRLTDLQAALGLSQLARLDTFVEKRRHLVEIYRELLDNVTSVRIVTELDSGKTAWHLMPILIDFSEIKITKIELVKQLAANGVGTQVHYIPIHLQPYYQQFGFKRGDYPNAERFYDQELSLPLYFDLKETEVRQIINVLKNCLK